MPSTKPNDATRLIRMLDRRATKYLLNWLWNELKDLPKDDLISLFNQAEELPEESSWNQWVESIVSGACLAILKQTHNWEPSAVVVAE